MKKFIENVKNAVIEIEVSAFAKLNSKRGAYDEKMVLTVLAILVGLAIFAFIINNLMPKAFSWIEQKVNQLFNW